jgi:hypothetical protein
VIDTLAAQDVAIRGAQAAAFQGGFGPPMLGPTYGATGGYPPPTYMPFGPTPGGAPGLIYPPPLFGFVDERTGGRSRPVGSPSTRRTGRPPPRESPCPAPPKRPRA